MRPRRKVDPYWMMAPTAALLIVFFIYPLLIAGYYSFFAWDLLTPPVAVGLDNYRFLLESGEIWRTFRITLVFSVIVVAGSMSLGLALALLGLEVRVPDPDPGSWSWIAGKALQAVVAGLLIAVLEETFFRGALFAAIRRREGLAPAILWSAGLYAVLHLMKPSALPAGVPFDWAGAWAMFAGVFLDVFQWRHLDTFLALLMVGVFLALVRDFTGHIGWCVGLHAGWVFVIQVTRRLTDGNPSSGLSFLTGDYDGIIGWLSLMWIGALALGYWRWGGRQGATEKVESA